MTLLGWGPSQCSERHCSADVRCLRAKGIRWCDQRVVHVSGASLHFLLHHSMRSTSAVSVLRQMFSVISLVIPFPLWSILIHVHVHVVRALTRSTSSASTTNFAPLIPSTSCLHPCPFQASLPHIKPFKILAETIGSMQAQLSDSPIK